MKNVHWPAVALALAAGAAAVCHEPAAAGVLAMCAFFMVIF